MSGSFVCRVYETKQYFLWVPKLSQTMVKCESREQKSHAHRRNVQIKKGKQSNLTKRIHTKQCKQSSEVCLVESAFQFGKSNFLNDRHFFKIQLWFLWRWTGLQSFLQRFLSTSDEKKHKIKTSFELGTEILNTLFVLIDLR